MSSIIEQLQLDKTFFYQLALITGLYLVLSQVYFKPFLKLFQKRHDRTVNAQKEAERMVQEAAAKMEEYEAKMSEARDLLRREVDLALGEAHKQETLILARAKEDAKQEIQAAQARLEAVQNEVRVGLNAEAAALAKRLAEGLLT